MTRLRALVTAPLRGEGFDKLRQLADVVYDPWIDQTPLRIYTAEQLAERASAENADVLVVESDSVGGPVFELPLLAVASTRGDPNNVDIAGATAAGIPVLHTPGRNADAVAEMTIALLFAATRHVLTADADVRAGQVFRDGTLPYQRFRAWEIAGRTAGLVGLGAVARALRWRLTGAGRERHRLRPVQRGGQPQPRRTARRGRRRLAARARHRRHRRDDRRRAVRGDARRRVFLNTARAQLHDTDALVDALRSGKVAAAGLDHFVGEWLPADHPLAAMPNVVLTPAHRRGHVEH